MAVNSATFQNSFDADMGLSFGSIRSVESLNHLDSAKLNAKTAPAFSLRSSLSAERRDSPCACCDGGYSAAPFTGT